MFRLLRARSYLTLGQLGGFIRSQPKDTFLTRNINRMATSTGKVKCDEFNGTGDVKVFLTKVDIVASIKGYTDEKKAQFLASKLLQPAFDVYMRMSDEDRKDFDKVKKELLTEFEKGQLNREEAIKLLSTRKRQAEESAQTFAYKLIELVKLAYSSFPDPQQKMIAKDYFMSGVHPAMHVALKSGATFSTSDINALATETTRLELAGVQSFASKEKASPKVEEVNLCEINETGIDSIANKVLEKLNLNSQNNQMRGDSYDDSGDSRVSYAPYRGRGGQGRGNRSRGRGNNSGGGQKKCRNCQSTEHVVRFCPLRFCQACGNRGHDQYSKDCPNYQI